MRSASDRRVFMHMAERNQSSKQEYKGRCRQNFGYEPEGREFESLRAHHPFNNLGRPGRFMTRSRRLPRVWMRPNTQHRKMSKSLSDGQSRVIMARGYDRSADEQRREPSECRGRSVAGGRSLAIGNVAALCVVKPASANFPDV